MSDYKRLKYLALAQPVQEWRSEEGEPSMMTGERMYYVVGPGGVSCWEHGARDRVSASYIAAANPAVVLGLIADLEGFMQGAKVEADAADEARAEARRLKAENAQLKNQEIELKAETLRAVNAHLDLFELYGERGNQVDQLKAECEGLRKDVELIGVSRAKIAGELSRLRAKHGDFTSGPGEDDAPYLFACSLDRKGCTVDFNGTPHHYIEMSEKFVACACGDEYRIDSYGAGFMAANGGVCENCDAANTCGSGEGSKTDESTAQQGSACRSEQP